MKTFLQHRLARIQHSARVSVCIVTTCSAATAGDNNEIGMIGDGWDGPGRHATTVYFHVENAHPTEGPEQREILLEALGEWASVVQIHFVELPFADAPRSIDIRFAGDEHCGLVPGECANPACEIVGGFPGSPGHASFPPGVETVCGPIAVEPYAGDVHLNAHGAYRTGPNQNGWQFKLIAAHNIGHALGLQDNPNPSDHNVMDRAISADDNFLLLSATDVAQIQQGYAPGVGSITTLEDLGVWVNANWAGAEFGSPGNPFNTITEGIAGVPPHAGGVTVHLLGGNYPENITLSKPCIITAEFSPASIGK